MVQMMEDVLVRLACTSRKCLKEDTISQGAHALCAATFCGEFLRSFKPETKKLSELGDVRLDVRRC